MEQGTTWRQGTDPKQAEIHEKRASFIGTKPVCCQSGKRGSIASWSYRLLAAGLALLPVASEDA